LPDGLVVAGKTGTSNDYRDSWFAGFSGGHLIVAWVGHDDNRPTALTGTTGGLAVWSRLMGSIATTPFEPVMPEALELRWVDYYSGHETSPYCNGSALAMPFPPGTLLQSEPRCPPGEDTTLFDPGALGPAPLDEAPPEGEPASAEEPAATTPP
jgi:penicillin-binding protein 1B